MEYRRLGKSGLQVSEFSFGSWVTFGKQVDEDAALALMAHGLRRRRSTSSTMPRAMRPANPKRVMGEALTSSAGAATASSCRARCSGAARSRRSAGFSRKHVTDACHAALKRLQVDYLDLYFCHRPDIDTPIEETVRAMHNLVQQGKVLYWGTSEWTAQQLTEAYAVARASA